MLTRTRACFGALLLAVALAASLALAACGGDGGGDAPPTTRTEDSQPSVPQDTSSNSNPVTPLQSGNVP